MAQYQGRWLDLLSFLGRRLRIVIILSPPLLPAHLKMSFPHGYGSLPGFDIILPAGDRFLGRGRGLSGWWTCTTTVVKSVFM